MVHCAETFHPSAVLILARKAVLPNHGNQPPTIHASTDRIDSAYADAANPAVSSYPWTPRGRYTDPNAIAKPRYPGLPFSHSSHP